MNKGVRIDIFSTDDMAYAKTNTPGKLDVRWEGLYELRSANKGKSCCCKVKIGGKEVSVNIRRLKKKAKKGYDVENLHEIITNKSKTCNYLNRIERKPWNIDCLKNENNKHYCYSL